MNKLPNDPLVVRLTDIQKAWILANMKEEYESATQSQGTHVVSLPDKEFRDQSAELHKQIKEQKNAASTS